MNKDTIRTTQLREIIIADINNKLLSTRGKRRINIDYIEKLIISTCEKYGYKPYSHIESIIFGGEVRGRFMKDLMRKLPPKSEVIKINSK
jgi:hypothetical protein